MVTEEFDRPWCNPIFGRRSSIERVDCIVVWFIIASGAFMRFVNLVILSAAWISSGPWPVPSRLPAMIEMAYKTDHLLY